MTGQEHIWEEEEGVGQTLQLVRKSAIARDTYTGKLSREKTFANFVDLSPFAKVFFVNIACARNQYVVYGVNPRNIHARRLAKVFSFKCFPL